MLFFSLLYFFPYSTIILEPTGIMPMLIAVWIPRKMLSPVMIFVFISAIARVDMVIFASYFNWLIKVTNPQIVLFFKKHSLS